MNEIMETQQHGRVLRVWLNRPDQRNVLTAELCRELVLTFDRAERDSSIRSVLLGARGNCFCAGMDYNELVESEVEKVSKVQETLFTIGARLTKPLIGVVRGAALGAGTGLVANCHVVIASENATFGITGIRIGLWPFVFFHAVSAAVGERRALAFTITGEVFNAAEALQIGLVHRVVATEDVEQRGLEVAQTVAEYSTNALHSGLGFVNGVQRETWKSAASVGRLVRDEFLKSNEFQARLAALVNQKQQTEI